MRLAETWARRHRTAVMLNLDELNAVLASAGHGSLRNRNLHSAVTRLDRAADRRRRAVARARG